MSEQSVLLDRLLAKFVAEVNGPPPTGHGLRMPAYPPTPVGKPSRLPPEVVRDMCRSKFHPGEPSVPCFKCRGTYVQSYVRLGWGGNMAWPKGPEYHCTWCVSEEKKLGQWRTP